MGVPMFELDEAEHTETEPVKWWELLDDTHAFVRFHYADIMATGSDELKQAVEIVLGGHRPGTRVKEESA